MGAIILTCVPSPLGSSRAGPLKRCPLRRHNPSWWRTSGTIGTATPMPLGFVFPTVPWLTPSPPFGECPLERGDALRLRRLGPVEAEEALPPTSALRARIRTRLGATGASFCEESDVDARALPKDPPTSAGSHDVGLVAPIPTQVRALTSQEFGPPGCRNTSRRRARCGLAPAPRPRARSSSGPAKVQIHDPDEEM